MPDDVEVLGEIDDLATITNYLLYTFVCTIPEGYPFRPNVQEVAEVIEMPIGALFEEANIRDEVRIVGGALDIRPSYVYRGHMVYGATAMLLTSFLDLTSGALAGEAAWKTDRK